MNVRIFRGKMTGEFCLGALVEVFPSQSLHQVSAELRLQKSAKEDLVSEMR